MMGILKTAGLAAIAVFTATTVGGWAVTTVENPPMGLPSGGSYRIEFTVRQHGATMLTGLKPQLRVLDAAGGARASGATFTANETGQGRYAATIQVPRADSVRLVIATGFGSSRASQLTLMPVPVVRAGSTPQRLAPAELGRRLFVAKGCGTCHLNGDVPEWAAWNESSVNIGPELTGRRLEASYVRQRLTNPASLPPIGADKVRMPTLGLSGAEVDALVALISGSKASVGN